MTRRRLLLSACLLALAAGLQARAGQGTAGLRRWPVQTKGQEGLRAPQEPATLPKSRSGFSRPRARPAPNAKPLSVKGEELFAREAGIDAPANGTARGFRVELPGGPGRGVALIKMGLRDGAGRVLSENFYWHAPRPEGYRGLNDLPAAEVACSAALVSGGGAARVNVELENRGPGVALAVQAIVRDAATGARVLPAYATDNFVSLLPGERRRLAVEVPANSRGRRMRVSLKGWNVRDVSVAVRPGR